MWNDPERLLWDREYEFECLRCGRRYRRQLERCWPCGSTGMIVPRSYRPADELRPHVSGITAKALASQDQRVFSIPAYPTIRVGPGAVMILAGRPSAGKSTMGSKLIGSLPPAVIFSFEEQQGPTLADRLRRLELRIDTLWIEVPRSMSEVYQVMEKRRPSAVLVDSVSVSAFTPEDLESIAQAFSCVLVGVNHVRKDGMVAGDYGFEYGAGVVIHVEDGKWHMTKSRFQPLVSGSIFEEEATHAAK